MIIYGHEVCGAIDVETRCSHYHKEIDRIAIKFHCCGKYFPCYKCHEEFGCGKKAVWPRAKFNDKAILCGGCGSELSVNQYFDSGYQCPVCKADFNPGCGLHRELYFET